VFGYSSGIYLIWFRSTENIIYRYLSFDEDRLMWKKNILYQYLSQKLIINIKNVVIYKMDAFHIIFLNNFKTYKHFNVDVEACYCISWPVNSNLGGIVSIVYNLNEDVSLNFHQKV